MGFRTVIFGLLRLREAKEQGNEKEDCKECSDWFLFHRFSPSKMIRSFGDIWRASRSPPNAA